MPAGAGGPGAELISPNALAGAPGLAAPPGLLDLAYASLPASGEVVHRAFAAALTELPALLPGFGYDAIGIAPSARRSLPDTRRPASPPRRTRSW